MLDQFPQWINYRLEPRPAPQKPDKIPIDALTGKAINAHDVRNHLTFAEAYRRALEYRLGVGFDLQPLDGLCCVDLDGVRDPQTGELNAKAQAIIDKFPGAYLEVSVSQTGLHLWLRCDKAKLAGLATRFDGVEVYSADRFIAIGNHVSGDFSRDWTGELLDFVPVREALPGLPQLPDAAPKFDDLQISERIGKALTSSGGPSVAFGTKASFGDLWRGDATALARHFPSANGDVYDRSSADQSLMNQLAFWLDRDPASMDIAFRQSGLMREKYLQRQDYRASTIATAISGCQKVYDPNYNRRQLQIAANMLIGDDIQSADLLPDVLLVDQMIDRLVLIGGHSVADRKTKHVWSKDDAKTVFAASQFELTDANGKPITDVKGNAKLVPAFNVWLKSTTRRGVQQLSWKPVPDEIIRPPEGHGLAFNKFRGIPRQPIPAGFDWRSYAQPFIVHLQYLIPIESEFERFLQWLAHIAQRPDVLPESCWLFVATETGIGRNWLSSVLVRVFRGYCAAGVDLNALLDGPYNGRLSEKLIAIVDEIREGMAGDTRQKRAQKFKTLINEEFRHINGKHERQHTEFNCCRWIMFTNHPDAIPLEDNDRRVIVVDNPTARKPPEYFEMIYSLIDDPLFIASVQELLFSEDISRFKPGEHSPENEARANALESMRKPVEQAVFEFAKIWPGDIAGREDLLNYLRECGFGNQLPDAGYLNKMIIRAKMILPAKRYRRNHGVQESVIIVRNIDKTTVKNMGEAEIRNYIAECAQIFLKR